MRIYPMNKTIKNTLFATTFLAVGAAGVATSMAATQGNRPNFIR